MSVDIATLSIKVDSSGVTRGTRDIESMASAGEKAEQALAKMVAAIGGTYAIGRALQSAAREAMEFQHAMATVATVIDDRGKIPELTSKIRALSVEMGQMPTDSAKAMYDIVSAGATDASKAMDILTTADKLAVGGATEVGIAADGLTSIMAVYSGEVRNATEVADKMFVSAAVGKTTIAELSHHIGMVAPIANTAGVSLGELLGSIGALTKGGLNTATATTGIRSFLAQVIKHSDEASKVAKQLGFDYSVSALKAKGLVGFVEDLKAKTGGNTTTMGQIVNDIEGLNAALSLTGPMSKDFRDAVDAMGSSSGKTAEAFGIMAETSQFKMSQLKAKIANEAIEVGNALLGMVPLSGLVNHFGAITTCAGALVKSLGILLAMRGAAWAAEWAANLKMKIDVMLAARGHTIAMAQGDVAAAAAAVTNANAQLAKSRAMTVTSGNTFALAAAQKMIAAQEVVAAEATNVHTAALIRLKEAQSLTTGVAGGMKAVISALGGPVGIVTGLVLAGAWAWSSWSEKAQKAREEAQKFAMEKGDAASSAASLVAELRKESAILATAKQGSNEAAEATRKIHSVENDILALGPQYRELLKDKTKGAKELADQLERVARADVTSVQAQIDALEKRKSKVVGMNATLVKYGGWSTPDVDIADNKFNYGLTRTDLKKEYDGIEKALNDLYAKRGQVQNILNATAAQASKTGGGGKGGASGAGTEYGLTEYGREIQRLQEELTKLTVSERAAFEMKLKLMDNGAGGDVSKGMSLFDAITDRKTLEVENELLQKNLSLLLKKKEINESINPFAAYKRDTQGMDPLGEDIQRIEAQKDALERWKDVMPLESYTRALQNIRLAELRLKAESGSTWAIIGDTIAQNAGTATDAMVSWMNSTDGLARTWESLGDTVRNVLADMCRQMQKAIIQQQMMQPFMSWIGTAIGFGSNTSNTNPWGGKLYGSANGGTEWIDAAPSGSGGLASIPVAKASAAPVSSVIQINVQSDGTASSKITSSNANAMAQDLQRSVEPMVLQVIAKHMRPGGRLNPVVGGGIA